MKNVVLLILGFGLLFTVITKIAYREHQEKSLHPTVNELALDPDHMLINASHYLKEHLFHTSGEFVDKAMDAMRLIEKDTDPVSKDAIEIAISDLMLVKEEMSHNEINPDVINHVFVRALNSLTLAQLRTSESYEADGEYSKAHYALKYAVQHVQNAQTLSKGSEWALERQIFLSLDSLLHNRSLKPQEKVARMDLIITGLDTLKW